MAQKVAFQYSVALPGQAEYIRAISRFADEIEDWKPFWDDWFRDAWVRHVQVHYETQGRSTGDTWKPLSEAYGTWKQKHWPGLPVGVLSGALRESLTFPDDTNAIWESKKDSLEVGTAVPYAMYQQLGTARSGAASGLKEYRGYRYGAGFGTPARPPLRINNEFSMLMGRMLQEYAVKFIRGQL